ncbi:MAG: DUF3618 domain-containing protein [Chloroflexota bacterium]|nr:DUF3618 domain-containing protein [Chloroflexota bacterium]
MGERSGQLGRPTPGGSRVEIRRVGDPAAPGTSGAADDGPESPEEHAETAVAREEIEQTRAEMSETIDAIQSRLDPEVLTEQAKDSAQEVADRAIQQAKEAVQEVAERAIPQAKEAVQEATDHAIQQAKTALADMTGQAGAALRAATIGKVEDMARNAGDTASGWRHTLMETIKAHPVPSAVAGLSLGWLYLNRSSGSSGARPSYQQGYQPASGYRPAGYAGDAGYRSGEYRPTGSGSMSSGNTGSGIGAMADRAQESVGRAADKTQQRVGDAVDTVQETASNVAERAQETAGQVVDSVQETAGQVVDSVQDTASRAQGFLQRQLQENPLAVGATALAIGAALGAAMGTTPQEDKFFGETRDRLMGRAQEATQDTMEKVERVVDEVQHTAKREAQGQSLIPTS